MADDQVKLTEKSVIPERSPTLLPDEKTVDFTASFEIYTNGTKRIFTQAMYHNQSADVYITSVNPSTIYVKKRGITWDDFFKTLPFSVTSDCLITGTKQTFCSTNTQKLLFYINEIETADALDRQIKEGDLLKIVYGN